MPLKISAGRNLMRDVVACPDGVRSTATHKVQLEGALTQFAAKAPFLIGSVVYVDEGPRTPWHPSYDPKRTGH